MNNPNPSSPVVSHRAAAGESLPGPAAHAPDDGGAASAVRAHWRRARIRVSIIVALWAAAFLVFALSMTLGPLHLGLGDVLTALLSPGETDRLHTVVLELRLPPALLALLVGAALALAGLQMQTILDNPLAEPFTLGVSAAAACGAAIAITTGLVLPFVPAATLSIAAGVLALLASGVIALAARSHRAGRESMILLGIALVFGFQAVLALLQYTASTEALQQIVFWSLGSLTRAKWWSVGAITATLLVVGAFFWAHNWKLTALRLGEARAAAMGINVPRLRTWTLIGVSLLAAVSVAAVGVIGFIGLVGPHVARILVGEDQRYLFPAATACGALLLTSAHAASLILVPGVVLPVGILTALVGVPVFIAIILGRRRRYSGIA